jgi:tRNA-dihydrouridine synthase
MTDPLQLTPLTLRGTTFGPPLFCAPMANLTHSAWRRLMADYGGCGAVFSEMLSARMLLHERIDVSPWLKRRPGDGRIIYQLLVSDTFRLPESLDRLAALRPDGLDLNCACGAPLVRHRGGGAALFEDADRMRDIIRVMRRCYAGPLTVKIRLGSQKADWRERLLERVRILEGEGVDALILHPRFHEDQFRRHARHEVYAELAAATRLPLIANGDISGPDYVRKHAALFAPVSGLMVGRLAAAQPWLFGRWHNPCLTVDPADVVRRLSAYLAEDFTPDKALRRLKIWMPYFACNYVFGHTLFKAVQQAADWDQAVARALDFLASDPERLDPISVSGL